MTLPLPTDYSRCLGHPPGHTGKASPKTWCAHLKTCARHQTISFDTRGDPYAVHPCLCEERDKAFYIGVGAPREAAP